MTASVEPNLGLYYGWALGENGWKTGMDSNLTTLGSVVQLSVLTIGLTAPPGSPADGDRHIVGLSPTGAWTSKQGNIAAFVQGVWQFYSPKEGWVAWVVSESTEYRMISGAWQRNIPLRPYDMHITVNGRPSAGSTLARITFPRITQLPVNLPGSIALAEIAATNSAVAKMYRHYSGTVAQIGTITWGALSNIATFSFSTNTVFGVGEVLEIIAPEVVDASLGDLSIVIVGEVNGT